MAAESLYKKTLREQIYDRLYAEITAADSYEGKRLAPVSELAQMLGTSIRTVQLALDQLHSEGYIYRRRGVGTFVARQAPALEVSDQCVVAMPMHDEIWSVLTGQIVRELHLSGRIPFTIDTRHPDAAALLHRAARGPINTFILRGNRAFPFHLLDQPAFRNKQIIAVEEWATQEVRPNMHFVLHDYAYGGQQLAAHLLNRRHRRVVIVAAPDSLAKLQSRDGILCGTSRGRSFIDYWTEHGGTWVGLPIRETPTSLSGIDLDLGALLDELVGPDPATAVFGYRDVEAWTVQSLLHRHRPDLLKQVEIVGYGDTFWSRAARPPLTTVAYPLEDTAQWIRQLFDTQFSLGQTAESKRLLVRPQLIDRSRLATGTQQTAIEPAGLQDGRIA